jgi:hypothetical protein
MTELDQLLFQWGAAHRLTDREVSVIRDNVLAAGRAGEPSLDVDWFWKLMRPVTSLLEQPGDLGTAQRSRRWPYWSDDDSPGYRLYLQLA